MTGIQIVLVLAAFVWLARFLARARARGAVRAAAVAAAAGAVTLVLFPDLSVTLAHAVGVARGVDLVIYLAFVAFGFLWLQLVRRQDDLDAKLTELVRALALREAELDAAPSTAPSSLTAGDPRSG